MTIVYYIILIAFIITLIFLFHSIFIKYKQQYILTRASEKISDSYLIFTSNGKVTNYNKSIIKLLEIDENVLNKKTIYDIFSTNKFEKKDIDKIFEACKQIRKSNEIIKFELKTIDKKSIFNVEIKSIVNNDVFLRYVMIFKDVTNTYEIIEELQSNQDMMANREKFATLGQLISRNCTFIKISYFYIIRRIGWS